MLTILNQPGHYAASGLPRYRQIANALRDRIQRHEWVVDARLPGEEQLAEQFGVSKLTMRQALGLLLAEGFIRRVHGKGTFVTDLWQPTTVLTYSSPLAEVLQDSTGSHVQVLDAELVHGPQAAFVDLDIPPNGPAFRVRRVHRLDDRPKAYVVSYLSPELSEELDPEDLRQVPLILGLEARMGQRFDVARQRITASLADEETAAHLQVAFGSAVLLIHRTYYTSEGKAGYVAHLHYPGGLFAYEVRLERNAQSGHQGWSLLEASHDREHV